MVAALLNTKLSRLVALGAAAVGMSVFAPVALSQEVIEIDGSSTVFPITEAVAEEFQNETGNRVTVGVSGTGGGFAKFCAGETVISGASRPIKASEMELCAEAGIEYIEIPVAFDAITVVINPANTWATSMTTEQLATIWDSSAEGTITNWNQVDSSFPDAPLNLFAPGTDSGTFDYFIEEVVQAEFGDEAESRGDYTASEDDNILVVGVERDENALAYFGFSYFKENQAGLQAVEIDGVLPSDQTVNDGSYTPLSRPIFIYVRPDALARPEVQAFVEYYIENAPVLVGEVGYVPLSSEAYMLGMDLVNTQTVGTVYQTNEVSGLDLEEIITLERTTEAPAE